MRRRQMLRRHQHRALALAAWVDSVHRQARYDAMFKEVLETIIERTEGSLGALIMGIDGIAVERLLKDAGQEANLDVAAAEFTSLVRSAQKAGKDTGLGKLRELMISLEGAVVIMRLLGRDYFVVLAMGPEGNLGRARFELRKAELQIASEFAL
jgi:predicted regulator of Ras-like GTPase activity (Roadblock/LC7/MglB family)